MKHKLIFALIANVSFAQISLSTVDQTIQSLSEKNTINSHLTPAILEFLKNKSQNQSLYYDQFQRRKDAQGLDRIYDFEHFRIHYTIDGNHAINPIDLNNNSIPDYIDSLSAIIKNTSYHFHKQLSYSLPPSDGFYNPGMNNGGSGHYDIYLRSISSNYYGFTYPEVPAQNNGNNENSNDLKENFAYATYLVLRNNYNGFPGAEIENLKVTFAHEYFHSIQFGYNAFEKRWLLESSAVWAEEQVYDDINDCYQFLPNWFKYPHYSLDESGTLREYGTFIFFEYISENIADPSIVRDIFTKSAITSNNTHDQSHRVIDDALRPYGKSFQKALNEMSIANKILSSSNSLQSYRYPEADQYPINGPTIYKNVDYIKGNKLTVSSNQLKRFASQYIEINTISPIFIELNNKNGPIDDMQLNTILHKTDGSYFIISNPSINVDPKDIKSISLSIVSQDTIGKEWDFEINIQDGVPGIAATFPTEFTLKNAYPNPFNSTVQFYINVLKPTLIDIYIINTLGKRVKNIYKGNIETGSQKLLWNGKSNKNDKISSGVYYIIAKGNYTEERIPITLIK